MSKRILVTGGAGFIGSAFINHVQKNGDQIFVIDDLSFGNRQFISVPETHFFKADIRDAGRMQSIFSDVQPDWVLHLAAIHFIPYCNQHPFESSEINIRGTMNILDAARQTPSISRLLFASTAAVYPIHDLAISEDFRLEPLDIYGLSKLAGERLCKEFFLASGIPTIICRFFNAFGPNETNPHLIPEIQKQVNDGLRTVRLGNLDPKRDFIHTHDMARAMQALLEKLDNGFEIFNLGRGIEYSVRDVVTAFASQIGAPIQIETDPARVRKVERMHLLADISKLCRYTDWQPEISLEEGIKTLIRS